MNLRFKHVGVVVKDIKEYLEQNVVAQAGDVIYDEIQDADICFIKLNPSETAIELIQPRGPNSKTYNFLQKTGGGLHHVCYGLDSVAEAEKILAEKGMRKVFGPVPAKALGCRYVLFAYTRNRELVEFEID